MKDSDCPRIIPNDNKIDVTLALNLIYKNILVFCFSFQNTADDLRLIEQEQERFVLQYDEYTKLNSKSYGVNHAFL